MYLKRKLLEKPTVSVPYDEAKWVLEIVDIVAKFHYAAILVDTTNIDSGFESHDEIGRRSPVSTLKSCAYDTNLWYVTFAQYATSGRTTIENK